MTIMRNNDCKKIFFVIFFFKSKTGTYFKNKPSTITIWNFDPKSLTRGHKT